MTAGATACRAREVISMKTRSHLFGIALFTVMAGSPVLLQAANPPEGQFISSASAGDWRASKLVGVNIYGPSDESIGKVDDVLVDASGSTKAVVIGVGGFLGMGKKEVALPFSEVKWSDKPAPPKAATAPAPAGGAVPPAATTPPATAPMASNTVYDYPDHGSVSLTKDQLKAAPDFHYASEKK
jgi:hypothetical protein